MCSSDLSEHQVLEPGRAVRPHDDEVDGFLFRAGQDVLNRQTRFDDDLDGQARRTGGRGERLGLFLELRGFNLPGREFAADGRHRQPGHGQKDLVVDVEHRHACREEPGDDDRLLERVLGGVREVGGTEDASNSQHGNSVGAAGRRCRLSVDGPVPSYATCTFPTGSNGNFHPHHWHPHCAPVGCGHWFLSGRDRELRVMTMPVHVTFRDLATNDTLDALIRERADSLQTSYGRIQNCRVLVEVPHRHHRSGNRYQVRIERSGLSKRMAWSLGFVCHNNPPRSQAMEGIIQLTDAQRKTVLSHFRFGSTPQDFGYFRTRWSCEILSELLLEQESVVCSSETVRRWMQHFGFVWRRPGPIVGPTDPFYDEKMRKIRKLLRGLPANEIAVFQDEVDINLNPKIGSQWMPRGLQAEVETPGNNRKLYLSGSLAWTTGTLLVSEPQTRRNSDSFLDHLDDLRRRLRGSQYPSGGLSSL